MNKLFDWYGFAILVNYFNIFINYETTILLKNNF